MSPILRLTLSIFLLAFVTVKATAQITIESIDIKNVSCHGGNDGEITITITGGTAPFEYMLIRTAPGFAIDLITSSQRTATFPNLTPVIAGTYLVFVGDGTYSAFMPTSVGQPAQLTANISPDPAQICTGGNLQLNGNPAGGTGSFTHQWTGPGAIYLSSTTIANPIFNSTVVGSYNLTYTVTDQNGCVVSDIITVTNSVPVTNAGVDGSICGTVFTLGASTSFGTGTWSYTGPGTASFGNINSPTSTVTVSISGVYTFTWTESNGGCIDSDDVTVTFLPQPTLTVIPNNPSTPTATDGSIVATVSEGTSPYIYTLDDGLGNIISSGPIASTFYLFSSLGGGSYTVTVTDNNNCSATRSVILSSAPPLTVNTQTTPACTGNDGSIIIEIISGQTPFNITVAQVPGGTVFSTTSSNFDYTIPGLSAGNYSISIQDGAANTFNTTVTVAAGPTASISYVGSPFCRTGTATVTQTGQGGGTYSATPAGLVIDPNTGTINLAASAAGNYTITYSFNDGVCFGTTQTTVVVGDLGTITISYAQPIFCAQGTATVTITGLPMQFTERVFTAGHIATDGLFDLSQNFSRCPGLLTVPIPIGAVITGVDVEYTMRAHLSPLAWIADQRSQLRVTNPGGISEPTVTRGPANLLNPGTHTYLRTNLNIANGVTGGGNINFALHAGRVQSFPATNTDCLTNRQRVDNNTWRVRVYHTGVHSFYALPAGLVIDPVTGEVDLAASAPGTYTVYFEFGDGTCTGIATTQITVVALPTATISYPDSPFCSVGTGTVTQTGQAGGLYTSTAGLVINPLTGEINLETSTPGTYTVTYTFSNGTCQNTTTAQVVINPLPQATISYTGSPFCATGTANVTITGQAGGTFSATPAGLSIDPATGAINLAASTPGIYTVTYIFSDGVCDNFTTTTVEVLPLPTATISYDLSPYCAFGIATVTRTGQAGGTFSSTPGLLIDATTGDINLTGSTPGTYTVTYTFSNGTCTSSTTALVTINPLPVATISYPGSPFCNTGTATVSQTGQPGGIFSATPAGLSIDAATGAINLAASTPGTYNVRYEFSDGICDNYTSTTVVVNAIPTATISYPGSPFCATGFADVTITGQTGGTFSSTAGLVINTTTGQVNLTASTPGNYTVTYTFSNGLCTNQTTALITINPLPVASISYAGSPFCPSGIGVVTLTGQAGGTYSSTVGLVIDSATGTIDLEASVPGTYTVTYSFTDGTCSTSTTTNIIIRNLPTATISYGQASLCAIGIANVTITGQTGGTFSSAPAGLSLNAVTGEINLETSAIGIYTITYDFTDGFCTNSTTTTLEVLALPTATISYEEAYFCAFGFADVVLTGQAGGTFSSTAGLVIDAATGRVNLETSLSGTYTVTYEFSNGGCTNFATAEITLRAQPQAQISYSNATLCATGTAVVTITGQTGGIFNAAPVGLEVDLTSGTIDLSTSIPGTYTVYYRFDDGFCENITSTIITVAEAPLLLLGGTTNAICAGEASGTITVEAIDGQLPYTFELLDADGITVLQSFIISTPGSFTFSNIPPGLFFARVTDGNMCGSSSIGPILIDEPDSITIDPASIVIANESCLGANDGSVSLLAQGGTGNLHYSILRNGFVLSGPQTNNGTFTDLAPGDYTIRIIDDSGCQIELSITIASSAPAFAGDDQTICLGVQATIGIEIINPDPAIIFEWTSQPTDLSISDSTVSNPTVSPALTTTYILTQTNTLSGCVSRDTVMITVVGALPNAGTDQVICAGTSVILGPENPIAGNNFTWTSSNPAEVFDFNVPNPLVTPSITTTYILTEVFTAFGCVNTDTVVVTVNPVPLAETGPDLFICYGDTVTIGTVYTVPMPINSYLWRSEPFDISISDSTISNPTVSPRQSTTYTLEETFLATGCVTTRSVTVTVHEVPLALVTSDAVVCANTAINLGSDLASDTLSYLWSSEPTGFTSTERNPVVTPSQFALDANNRITFFLEARTQYCMAQNQVTIAVVEAPEVRIANDTVFCTAADAINLPLGGDSIPGYTYLWQSNTDTLFTSTEANPIVSPVVTTTYTLTVVNTVTGCSAVDSVTISISDLTLDMPSGLDICEDVASVVLGENALITGGMLPYQHSWTDADGNFVSDSLNPTVLAPFSTNYTLTITDALNCQTIRQFQVNITPGPQVYLTANGDSIRGTVAMYLGQSIIFEAYPDTLEFYEFYIFEAAVNGGETEPRLLQSGSSNIYVANDLAIGDTIFVRASDGTCWGESPWVTIAVNELPNAFTPDGDGINDIFAPGMEITIFNRWGQKIYEGTSGSAGWDGTYNGRNVSPGTYFYLLHVFDANLNKTTFKGSVAVIRGDPR